MPAQHRAPGMRDAVPCQKAFHGAGTPVAMLVAQGVRKEVGHPGKPQGALQLEPH